MNEKLVLIEEQDQIVVVTLNRPEMLNAFNMEMLDVLKEQLDMISLRPTVRAVIITGAGEKAFCVGADLKERSTFNEEKVKEYIFKIRDLFSLIDSLNKPVIACIKGIALGGGTELSLACDIRIASYDATFALTETRLGVIPGAGGTQRLPRLVGPGMAKEMIFTGRKVEAKEALQIGLVNHVFEKSLLLDECRKIASMICEAGPIAIKQAKYAIDAGLNTDLQRGLSIESEAYWVTIPTRDRLEGIVSFQKKRKPVYQGK